LIKSAFQNHFAQIPSVQKPRSSFRRVSRHKHTFDEGFLIPFYLDDVIPGDTFNVKASMFARLATPIFPIMDNMYLETFWFFVPNRLVWDNFVRQHGERPDPDSSTDFTTPTVTPNATSAAVGSLWDNFGLPIQNLDKVGPISALPFRGYRLIFNEWFRDQDLQDSLVISKGDGPDAIDVVAGTGSLPKRINKFKDYFTTARPSPQKGPSVDIPLGISAPVYGEQLTVDIHGHAWQAINEVTNVRTVSPSQVQPNATPLARQVVSSGNATGTQAGLYFSLGAKDDYTTNPTLVPPYADLTEGIGATVNEWRQAVVIQQAYELDMRGGTRYIEMIFNHYGVINPDFRLQRPEFLGYSKSQVNIHPIAQTSETSDTPQGNLSAFGTVSSQGNGFLKSFTEFGYVFGLVAVRSDLSYQECVDRHWSRQTRFDYYYPNFANLGEQAILRQELQVGNTEEVNLQVFGYQERWAEYRFKTSKVTGLFRSNAAGTLDAWHLAQELGGDVFLSDDFIEEDAPVDRTIAVPSEPHFIFDSIVENNAARVMPMYSAPGLTRM